MNVSEQYGSQWAEPFDYFDIERDLKIMGRAIGSDTDERVPSVNLVTPEIVGTWRLPDGRLVELAYGTGMMGSSWLYGVTVRTSENRYSNAGGCFHSLDAVWDHLFALYQEARGGTLEYGQEDSGDAQGS
jgi:hypothetical protein